MCLKTFFLQSQSEVVKLSSGNKVKVKYNRVENFNLDYDSVLETITVLGVYCIKTNKLNSDIRTAATVGLK